jgi:hypothetical protein
MRETIGLSAVLYLPLRQKCLTMKVYKISSTNKYTYVRIAGLRVSSYEQCFVYGWGRRGRCTPFSEDRTHSVLF